MALAPSNLPVPRSRFGREMADLGRALVLEHGVRMDRLVWDADEVLWDWLMDFGELARGLPRYLMRPDMGHREQVRLVPGLFELLTGMHVASREAGLDPYLRIWTNGYPYRLHRIAAHIPELHALLGLPDPPACTARDLAHCPRLFFRGDYTRAVERLLEPDGVARVQQTWSPAARRALVRQLRHKPLDPHFKIPELAPLVGKHGFDGCTVLVDDLERNVWRFASTGRRAVRLAVRSPTVLGGRVPNSVWRRPREVLAKKRCTCTPGLAAALRRVFQPAGPRVLRVQPTRVPPDEPLRVFEIRIPDDRVRAEWIAPRKTLRRRLGNRATRRALIRRLEG